MAIEAQKYSDYYNNNVGGMPSALGGFQDFNWLMMDNHIITSTSTTNLNNNVFGFQQKPLLHLQNLQNYSLPNFHNGFGILPSSNNSVTTSESDDIPMTFSQGFAFLLDKHTQEIDRLILFQSERLRRALKEQAKQQVELLWKKIQVKGRMMVKQKEEEIAKGIKRKRELEESMLKIEAEKEAWRRSAAENETLVVSLNHALEQATSFGYTIPNHNNNGVDDAESCCDDNEYNNTETEKKMKMMKIKVCRVCKSKEASVLMLPCRHLSCCMGCNGLVDACPLCNSLKKASIQALFS